MKFALCITAILGVIIVLSIQMVRNSHEAIFKRSLPEASRTIEFYSEKPLLNGDCVVRAKVEMTSLDFRLLAMNLELSKIPAVTLNPMVNTSVCPWIVLPGDNDIVYFKKGERFQAWLFHDGNYAYYCNTGW